MILIPDRVESFQNLWFYPLTPILLTVYDKTSLAPPLDEDPPLHDRHVATHADHVGVGQESIIHYSALF